jgi:hypothetical protein
MPMSDAIDDAAVDIAERAEVSPDVAPEAIRDFVTACGWKHDGGAWWHPLAGMRSRRVEAGVVSRRPAAPLRPVAIGLRVLLPGVLGHAR